MAHLLHWALLFCLIPKALGGAALHDNSPECDCYVTDGSSSAYYNFHRFFDFRNFASLSGIYEHEPPNVTNSQSQGQEVGQPGFLDSTVFAKDWKIMTWRSQVTPSHPVILQNSRQNVWIQTDQDNSSSTHLALRSHRNLNFYSTGEVESLQKNLFYSSIRLRARVHGAAGAVAGIFTYLNDSTESDVEILTADPTNLIHYTNQPNTNSKGHTIAAAGTNATLPGHALWTEWNTHRLDWTPGISAWYVNDIFVANKTYGIPRAPSYLTFNMWSNGGNWSGEMALGSAAYLEIQWIDMVFNTSGPVTGSPKRGLRTRSNGCGTVCIVDNIQQPGFPEIVSSPMTSAASGAISKATLFFIWSLSVFTACFSIL